MLHVSSPFASAFHLLALLSFVYGSFVADLAELMEYYCSGICISRPAHDARRFWSFHFLPPRYPVLTVHSIGIAPPLSIFLDTLPSEKQASPHA